MWKQHTVVIEPHTGTNGLGQDTWGTGVPLTGWLEYQVKNVRNPQGSETVSTAQFHCDLGPTVPARSRGTLPDGSKPLVIKTGPLTAGTLPLPEHLVIWFE